MNRWWRLYSFIVDFFRDRPELVVFYGYAVILSAVALVAALTGFFTPFEIAVFAASAAIFGWVLIRTSINNLGGSPKSAPYELPEDRRVSRFEHEYEVHLGASTPPVVSAGETFVARFAAYTAVNRNEVWAIIKREAPTSQLRADLDHCRWRPGARVTVRLECGHATVSNPVQTFCWDASYKILRFDVTVADNVKGDTVILRFDVAVEEMSIISLRPEIKIRTLRTITESQRAGASD
jgi:hypothetical protein